jgi:hypothetical protein
MGVFADFYRAVTGGQKAEFPDGIHTPGDLIVDGALKVGTNQVDILAMMQPIGKLSWFEDYAAPSAAFPWFHLGQADAVVSDSNWPELVTYLRNKKLTFFDNGSSIPVNTFNIESYSLTANVVTLVFTNTTIEKAVLAALADDQLVHGSYTNWKILNLTTTLGAIVPGEYQISNINAGSRTISFIFTAANISSTPVSTTVEFYTHRILGSSTTANHYRVTGRTLMTVGDENGYIIGGLRRRDTIQGHYHELSGNNQPLMTLPGASSSIGTGAFTVDYNSHISAPITDGTNGTPRTAKTTQSASLGAYLYMWAGSYNP